MVCLKLTTRMGVLMSVLFFWSMKTGFGTGPCRPICTGRNCITVNRDRVDFKTAEETCHDINGELMRFQLQTDERTLDILSQELLGHFWIGLRLPAGACSNLSASLRGYEWTSGSRRRSSMLSFNPWKDSVKVCSPQCVSLSNDHKWTERPCTDKIDGFLCRTKHKDACEKQAFADPNIFQSSKGCSDGPCEHHCNEVTGGYKCSCFKGYIPDKKDLRRCILYCGQEKCPVTCERDSDNCSCPKGFIMDGNFCQDIDECLMDSCDEDCRNTYGGFVCSCKKGYVLKKQVQCIKADSESFDITTPVTEGFIKPAINNNTLKASSVSAGGFVWIWIFVAGAVVVLIFVIRFYVVKRLKLRQQSSNQQSTAAAPGNNIECLISSKQ